jgi:hypothetical protein
VANLSAQSKKSVDYIVNGTKPFPDWLKNHAIFKSTGKLDKVFPRIGLPNFKESAEIMNTAEAKNDAISLVGSLSNKINIIRNECYGRLNTCLNSKEPNRNEVCHRYQSLINAIGSVQYSLSFNDYTTFDRGKINLKLRSDIFNGDNKPLFREGESILRVLGKIREMCVECGDNLVNFFPEIDKMPEFKAFSRTNVPNKKYTIVFSSTGEEGAWDLATISMRGITSCQTWTSPQSRGLIGTLASKYVGVIYVASDQDIPGYGSKMMNRSLVRFVIHTKTKRPALLIDKMYPAENKDTVECFKKILSEKTELDIIYHTSMNNEYLNYYIPDEPSNKMLAAGEVSYMDTRIQTLAHAPVIRVPEKDIDRLTVAFKSRVATELNNMARMRREMYEAAKVKRDAERAGYDSAKASWVEQWAGKPQNDRPKFGKSIPKIENELTAFGGGGVINLFRHFDKQYGANSAAGKLATMIFDSVEVPRPEECESEQEYHRRFLMSFLRNPSKVKAGAWRTVSAGAWMKSFPRSTDKLFAFVFGEVKVATMNEVRALLKKSSN